MLHTEHFQKANRSYELRHDNNGNAIHVFMKDMEYTVYPTLEAFIDHQINGLDSERFYADETLYNSICDCLIYDYAGIKEHFVTRPTATMPLWVYFKGNKLAGMCNTDISESNYGDTFEVIYVPVIDWQNEKVTVGNILSYRGKHSEAPNWSTITT